ncbi:hypothetical protein FOA43_001641 [Brettanomyces nanus]|uniref:Arrestin C-terminal-like domain-containing protein n=1 Tax=Eeniella nana TaxID=13502 RepID=A0A875S516_EENNA|nr:uncharacterized protein FOA43_001641 [Brettanomyces nanus]QPG74314.1 hypothetical protein FOA43_001641 [Brettanomyces nanus]
MFAFSKGSQQIKPSLFDIRIHSADRNILFLEGQTAEANSLVISGHVVFALPETVMIKSVSLSLLGTFRLDFLESFQDDTGKIIAACPIRRENEVVKCVWKNLLTSAHGELLKTGCEEKDGKADSFAPVASQLAGRLTGSRSKKPIIMFFSENIPSGETPFPGTSDSSLLYELPRGNYSLPFEVMLPGNIPETVEGLRCGVVLYRLQSILECSKQFRKDSRTSKYLRIFRRPLTTEVTLCEDCSVENTWPGKMQYEVRLPRRAIPLGGRTKIHILIIPLTKGLKLGKMTASVQQYFSLKGDDDESFEDEKTVYKCTLPAVSMEDLSPDKWSLEAKISLPSNLKLCTPDIDLKDEIIRVRHKLIVDINIINPDGHTSQIKSKLPVIFYISGREMLLGRNAYVDHNGRVRFKVGTTKLFHQPREDAQDSDVVSTPCEGLSPLPAQQSQSEQDHRQPQIDSQVAQSERHHHIHCHHHGSEEIRIDPNYDFGRELEPDSPNNEDLETSQFLPSYEDSSRDLYLDPQLVSPMGSPMVSPMPVSDESSAGSYFDIDPMLLHRAPNSVSLSPAIQYISRVNSAVGIPKFGGFINKVPPYNSVYDYDYSVSTDPAPPYESISTPETDTLSEEGSGILGEIQSEATSEIEFSDHLIRKVVEGRHNMPNIGSSRTHINTTGSHLRLSSPSSSDSIPPLRKTLSSTQYRLPVAGSQGFYRNLSSDHINHRPVSATSSSANSTKQEPVRLSAPPKTIFSLNLPSELHEKSEEGTS